MYLRLGERGVDELAAVMDIDKPQELDLAHRDIDLDLSKGAAEGIGIVSDGVGRLGGDVLRVHGVVLRGHRELFQRHEHHAVVLADDVAVDDIHVVDRLTGELCRVS